MTRLLRARPALAALTLAAAAGTPASAQTSAPLAFSACASSNGSQCATLSVPLDRAVPATRLALQVRMLAARNVAQGTIVLLAGGPGEAALQPGGAYERNVSQSAPNRNVVIFNQRGTGATALRCAAFDGVSGASNLAKAAAACAAQIGPARDHYTTLDSVADIEDLRVALGADKITIVGVSYGTHVAQQYARAHPDRVAGLVLDSTLPPTGESMVDPDAYAGARRALRELCSRGACKGITNNLTRDVARLTAMTTRRGIPGVRVNLRGQGRATVFGGPRQPGALFSVLGLGDLSPAVRASFPAAVQAALNGDSSMLMRLSGGEDTGPSAPREFSTALLATTLCADATVPWTQAMPGPERIAARESLFRSTAPSVFAPFPRPGAGDTLSTLCILWPNSGAARAAVNPLPNVPTLILEGSQDLRTPIESARRVMAEIPQARLLVVRGSGHSILSRNAPCVNTALTAFLAGRTPGSSCGSVSEAGFSPTSVPIPPRSLASLAPYPGLTGRRGRTFAAVRLTVRDAGAATFIGRPVGIGQSVFPGLRSGVGAVSLSPAGVRLKLRNYQFVKGVVVSGSGLVSLGSKGRQLDLVVSGPAAAAGEIHIRDRIATGTLGGVPFRVTIPKATGR